MTIRPPRLIGPDIVRGAGHHRGIIRGTAGTIMTHGTGIHGIGTIRSTIPHGTTGVIPGITLGIHLATTAIMAVMAVAGRMSPIVEPAVVRGVVQG